MIVLSIHGFAAIVDARLHRRAEVLRDHLVDPNRARVAELGLLPGIGPARAEAIVLERVRHGPFRSAEDLGRVPGLGAASIARLRAYLRWPATAANR